MRAVVESSVLVTLNIALCLSLQLVSPPPDRALEFLSSGRSQSQSSQENTIVIQSKPYNVSNSNKSIEDIAEIRRNIYVQKEEQSEENLAEPKLPQYAIDCGNDKVCLEAHGLDYPEATFRPYTQEELEKLLAQYTASHGHPPEIEENTASNKLANLYMDDEEAVINVLESSPKNKDQEKSKSAGWHLLQSQKHHHPQDDKKGWVTLEPIPWAQSQIQKWEPNASPQIPSWDSPPQHHRPSSHWDSRPSHDYSTERPPWNKPSYEYKPSSWSSWTRPSSSFEDRPGGWGANPDIITDNQPGYFPGPPPSHRPWNDQESYSSNRPTQVYEERPQYHQSRPSSHPSEGAGQWVLLSSTKGYSVPHRHHRSQYQRAFTFGTKNPEGTAGISSHRAVRLTVLPADNSTNTTLSHNGLLEVESTLQTVEEAQREHAAKMLKLNTLSPEDVKLVALNGVESNDVRPTPSVARQNSRRSADSIQVFAASPTNTQSKTAVLAAIGAGMIPATMALLLPMVLGRRKRSTDAEEDERITNKTHNGPLKFKTLRYFSDYRNNQAS